VNNRAHNEVISENVGSTELKVCEGTGFVIDYCHRIGSKQNVKNIIQSLTYDCTVLESSEKGMRIDQAVSSHYAGTRP
jgi:hypothetical protein